MGISNNYGADYNVEDIRQVGTSSKSTTSRVYWCSQSGEDNAVLTITFAKPVIASGFRVKPYVGYVSKFFNGYTLRVDDELIASVNSNDQPTEVGWQEFTFDRRKGRKYSLTLKKKSDEDYICLTAMEMQLQEGKNVIINFKKCLNVRQKLGTRN